MTVEIPKYPFIGIDDPAVSRYLYKKIGINSSLMLPENNSRIRNSFLANLSLSKEVANFTLNRQEVHIWKISVQDNFHDLFKKYRFILNREEFAKAKAFHWVGDVRSYLTSRIVQRVLFGKYLSESPPTIQFVNKKGKPSLIAKVPFRYNLSYTDKIIVISVGLCESGIDIERIRHNFDYEELLPACFSDTESEYITYSSNDSREEFYLQWTRKEALLKYTGQGIIDDLSIVPSLNGVHYSLNEQLPIQSDLSVMSFKIDPEYVVSLAYPSTVSKIEYFEWE